MGIGTVFSSLLAIALSMVLVIGLAWATIWVLRKWQDRTMGVDADGNPADRSLRFIRALPLGQRERVVLIEVGDETMLLGVGTGAITMLSRWDRNQRPLPVPGPVPADATAPEFPPSKTPGGARQWP